MIPTGAVLYKCAPMLARLSGLRPGTIGATLYVSHSTDDGRRSRRSSAAATVGVLPAASLPNTTFRDGITENFTASPTYAGHLY